MEVMLKRGLGIHMVYLAVLTAVEYERVVERLLQLAVNRAGYDDLQTYRLRKYPGKSGHEHTIDVSFELVIAGLRFLILVECKRYKRRVGIDDLMEFAYRVRDIGANKGVLVTTHGFQDGAIDVAKSEGIGLLIAARGKLHYYVGASYEEFKYWLASLAFQVDQRRNQLSIVPQRIVVGNATARISGVNDTDNGEVVFLLPSDLPEPEVSLSDWKGCRLDSVAIDSLV
jgi:Restriction endonuclease